MSVESDLWRPKAHGAPVEDDTEREAQELSALLGTPVLRERVGVARLLVRAWQNTRWPGGNKKPLRALGESLGRSPQLFAAWVGTPTKPHIQTFVDLEEPTHITLADWLHAFGWLREPPRRSDLGPALQSVVLLLQRLPEDAQASVVAGLHHLLHAREAL